MFCPTGGPGNPRPSPSKRSLLPPDLERLEKRAFFLSDVSSPGVNRDRALCFQLPTRQLLARNGWTRPQLPVTAEQSETCSWGHGSSEKRVRYPPLVQDKQLAGLFSTKGKQRASRAGWNHPLWSHILLVVDGPLPTGQGRRSEPGSAPPHAYLNRARSSSCALLVLIFFPSSSSTQSQLKPSPPSPSIPRPPFQRTRTETRAQKTGRFTDRLLISFLSTSFLGS